MDSSVYKGSVMSKGSARVNFLVRSCTEDDLPALEWMGLFTPHREIIGMAFDRQRQGDVLMLLAIAAGFPIAQAWIDFARKRNDRAAVLWAVRTFPPLQGLGIGGHLMSAAEAVIRNRGVVRSELGVECANSAARCFYERLGYRVVGMLAESFGYTTPEGTAVEVPLLEWWMAKELGGQRQ